MRIKTWGRSAAYEVTRIEDADPEALAQAALDFIDRRDYFASKAEHRLLAANALATLALYREIATRDE